MIFDQNYEISHGTDQILNEELTSEFIGGKATFLDGMAISETVPQFWIYP